jgi:hypothetical protein
MCLLSGMNWVLIFQKTTFFIVTAVKTSNLTFCTCLKHVPLALTRVYNYSIAVRSSVTLNGRKILKNKLEKSKAVEGKGRSPV